MNEFEINDMEQIIVVESDHLPPDAERGTIAIIEKTSEMALYDGTSWLNLRDKMISVDLLTIALLNDFVIAGGISNEQLIGAFNKCKDEIGNILIAQLRSERVK